MTFECVQVMHSAFEALHAGAEKDSCLPLYNRAMVAMVQWQNDDTWVPHSQDNAPPKKPTLGS